jgi:hypothetical protein
MSVMSLIQRAFGIIDYQKQTAPYQYIPLDLSTNEIRLLVLSPGKRTDKIILKLVHVILDGNLSYEALSYTWGDANKVRLVLLDGCLTTITANLEVALRSLRHVCEERTLWVDALCINQQDLHERNHQVSRMRDIYLNADTVIAWLGEPTDDTEKAIQEIESIVQRVSDNEDVFFDDDVEPYYLTPQILTDLGFNLETIDWIAIWIFLERPYWSRIWVVQELLCSGVFGTDRCVMQCGHLQIQKRVYVTFCMFMAQINLASIHFGIERENTIQYLQPLLTRIQRGTPPGFTMFGALAISGIGDSDSPGNGEITSLLHFTLSFQASDERDKVFAVLGLARNVNCQVDYSKSASQIYRELTWATIQTTESLHCIRGNRASKNKLGCSWTIPDHYSEATACTFIGGWSFEIPYCNASKNKVQVNLEGQGKLLRCKGVAAGALVTVIGPFETPSPQMMRTMSYQQIAEASKTRQLREYCKTITDPTQREIFWRTLLMDGDRRGSFMKPTYPASADLEIGYARLFEGREIPDNIDNKTWADIKSRFSYFQQNIAEHCFFETDHGRMGLGPFDSKPGDVVAVLLGGSLCFILRPRGDFFEMIGEAYIQGLMDGQAIEKDEEGNILSLRDFVLC